MYVYTFLFTFHKRRNSILAIVNFLSALLCKILRIRRVLLIIRYPIEINAISLGVQNNNNNDINAKRSVGVAGR